ncbi:MAG: hypothetical protein IJ121_03660 [Eubacterium sp.]|nr:hypothetical protein [Eubacterium sp.]
MIKNKKAAFGLFVVIFPAFWNLLDFIWSVFIVNGAYHFSGVSDLVIPMTVAIISGYLLFLRK